MKMTLQKAKLVFRVEEAQSEIHGKPSLVDWKESEFRNDPFSFDVNAPQDYLVLFDEITLMSQVMKTVGVMTDHKSGLPRTSYAGVVVHRYYGYRIFLALKDSPLLDHSRD